MNKFFKWIEDHLFGIVYASIGIYTFWHTTNSVASVFDGPKPSEGIEQIFWYISGAFGAIAIDVGAYATANALSKKRSWFMIAAFIVTAATSSLTQLIYASQHFQTISFASGVTGQWREFLTPVMNSLPFIFAIAMPLFAVMFTFAKIKRHNDEESELSEADKLFRLAMEQRGLNNLTISAPLRTPEQQASNLLPSGNEKKLYVFKCAECGFSGKYNDETTRIRIAKSHVRRMHKTADTNEKIAMVLTKSEFNEEIVPIATAEIITNEPISIGEKVSPVERLEPVDAKPTPVDLNDTQRMIAVDSSIAGE